MSHEVEMKALAERRIEGAVKIDRIQDPEPVRFGKGNLVEYVVRDIAEILARINDVERPGGNFTVGDRR